jgi:uncharacterized membrane protein YkoI
MKTRNLLMVVAIGAGLTLGLTVRAAEHRGEVVELKTLPAAVQKTIAEKAAGGKIVKVQREDDKSGKWNYEVVVKTDGKEWGFEVDPNGKFVKKHSDHTKTE